MNTDRRTFIVGALTFTAIAVATEQAASQSCLDQVANEDLNIDELHVSIEDTVVDAETRPWQAEILVRLNKPAVQTVSLKFATGDDTAAHGIQFKRAAGFLVFQPGEQFKIITIEMITPLGEGEQFNLMADWPQNIPPVLVTRNTARVSRGSAPSPKPQADIFPLPAKPPLSRILFETDMSGFAATDSGIAEKGELVWMSRLSHGREQPANGELGYYVDALLNPGTTPWGRNNGRFFLQAERHPSGVRDLYGRPVTDPAGRPYGYSSSIATTKHLFNGVTPGCYVEARLQLDPVFGSWPAFWLLPDDERSETLEIDILEGFFRRAALPSPNLEMMGSTVHWNEVPFGHRLYNQSASILEDLVPGFNPFAPHVWGLHWSCSALTFYADDIPYFQMPNVLPSKNCYLLLNVAVGGQAGEPLRRTQFQPRLYVDWVRVSRAVE
jgi:hypothetical protein